MLEEQFSVGPVYRRVAQQVVCHGKVRLPDGPEGLVGRRVAVVRGGSEHETLRRWQSDLPALNWEIRGDASHGALLEEVGAGRIDCTMANATLVAAVRRLRPALQVAFDAAEPQEWVWLLRKDNRQLARAVDHWFDDIKASGFLAAVEDRNFSHLETYDVRDLEIFRHRIANRLPEYRALFETAAREMKLPWTLLAAQAYQESHWDPEATSPTGVKGIMMLTKATAATLGIKDRTDPVESIRAGARYLRDLLDTLPGDMDEPDRLNQALAAYTIGLRRSVEM